jgi:hypothetical protein
MRLLLLALVTTLAVWAASPDLDEPPFYDRPLSDYTAERLPSWLKLSGEFRTRVEGRTAFGFQPGNNDDYGLFRTRLNAEFLPTPWLDFYFQMQDSHVAGLDSGRPLTIFKDPFDLRQAYVRFGKPGGLLKLTVGRQLLLYGAQRLIGPLDWTNTSRNWDAVKLEIGTADAKVDLFASSVVVINPDGAIDHSRPGYNIHGAYSSFRKIVPKSVFEPYLLWKTGGASIFTGGIRLAAPPGTAGLHGYDYQLELVRQWGHVGTLDHSAWAGVLGGGRTLPSLGWSTHVSAEYNAASGDRNPNDNQHHTFDQLLGTNHALYGLVDVLGWQNMHQVRVGADAKPNKRLQLAADYRWLWLDSPRDALYDVTGRVSVKPRAGNSARGIGTELDFTALWTAAKQWKVGGGVGHLFPGDFLKANSPGSGMTFPYLFAQYAF